MVGLVRVRFWWMWVANLFHGFAHYRFSAMTKNVFLKVDLDASWRSFFCWCRGMQEIWIMFFVFSLLCQLPPFFFCCCTLFMGSVSKLRTNRHNAFMFLGSTSVFTKSEGGSEQKYIFSIFHNTCTLQVDCLYTCTRTFFFVMTVLPKFAT